MNFNIEKRAMYEQIADKIEWMIMQDTTQVNQALPSEQVLATGYGVSRPVIREALKLVKERGLIHMRQGTATTIKAPENEDFNKVMTRFTSMNGISPMDIFQIRITLETLAAGLAAEHCTDSDIGRLRQINLDAQKTADDPERRTEADVTFHLYMAKMSQNDLLAAMIESLYRLTAPQECSLPEMIKASLGVSNANEDGIHYHNCIIDALRNHDIEKTKLLTEAHFITFMRNYEMRGANRV